MSGENLFIVMGVSGCGKTTLAQSLAEATGGRWLDADDFHSAENKARMADAIPLTDADRLPWLERLNAELRSRAGNGKPLFLACSALKQKYRERLLADLPGAKIIYLRGALETIRARLARRQNHFMPASLLESQFADLKEPRDAIVLDITLPPSRMVEDFLRATAAAD